MAAAKPKVDASVYMEQLNSLAHDITKRVCTPEYSHLLDMWKAFLGGFVGPELAKLDPTSIDEKRKALMEKYSKEAIHKMFHPDPVEKIIEVEKVVEKVVYRDSPIPASSTPSIDAINVTMPGPSPKNMRYRPSVNKLRQADRPMTPEERQNVITVFNKTQALMDKTDALCASLVEEHNKALSPGDKKTYPAQVAGYWSWLCRVVLKPQGDQDKIHAQTIKKGSLPVGCPQPIATDEFKKLIIANQEEQAALASHRAAYKSHMRSAPKPDDSAPSSISF